VKIDELLPRLRHLREESGLSQRQVAARMGVSQSTLSEFEARSVSNPKLVSLEKYLRAIGYQLTVEISVIDS